MDASLSEWKPLLRHDFCGDENDSARVAVLERYDIPSLEDDPELNALRAFAAKLCDAPIALVTLVDTDTQKFLSRQGLASTSTPRSVSFCQYAMVDDDIYIVDDASTHPDYRDNPLVTGEPYIRFYAGAPLVSEEGAPLGSLCIIDREARNGLSELQRDGLKVLADAVMRRLTARRREIEKTAGEIESERLLDQTQRQFDNLADALPQMAWSTDADGIPDYFNQRWYDFTGIEKGEYFSANWLELVHEDDRQRASEVWKAAVTTGEPYEVEYRLRTADGEYRWTLARGLPVRDDNGNIVRWFGSNTDIHETSLLMESQRLLSQELSHRIKNIFSVVSGLVSFASRDNPEIKGIAAEISDRIAALGRAHNYVRPVADEPASEITLKDMLDDLFAPYAEDGVPRVEVAGAEIVIRESAVTPLALAFHELATNAVKYGALSLPEGRVSLKIEDDGDALVMEWRESGGPQLDDVPHEGGFGTDLLGLSIERQLRGSVEREWKPEGLVATLRVQADAIKA
ncbi:PAS domain-containing protein [Sphingomicrobium marinum]|uniref:PAS domain-containing protein n=1 Tax=Sphingomicrobium marinum TaxID=1227950 RepID=UPI00223E9795|nr:PAS domain-containing protein [Sphingomicrobium marinum]